MKAFKTLFVSGMLLVASATAACSYGGVAVTADNKAVVAQNNGLLFGLLNKVYVCDVTPGGLANCQTAESP